MPSLIARDSCPACAERGADVLYACSYDEPALRYFAHERIAPFVRGGTFQVEECVACGLIYQREAPDDELLGYMYNADADYQWDASLVTFGHLRGLALEILSALAYLGLPPHEVTCLDFGMGWGTWGAIAHAFGCTCYGVETSEAKREFARTRGVTPLSLEEAREMHFDLINAEEVFEHLVAPRATLAALVEALADGGLLKIGVPNALRLKSALRHPNWRLAQYGAGHRLNAIAPLEHVNAFRGSSLIALAAANGLRVADVPVMRLYEPLDRHPARALRAVARRAYGRWYVWNGRNSTYRFFERNTDTA